MYQLILSLKSVFKRDAAHNSQSVTFIFVRASNYDSCRAHQPSSPWWSHWGPLWFSLLLDRPGYSRMVSLIWVSP